MIPQQAQAPVIVENLTTGFRASAVGADDLLVAAIGLAAGFILAAIARVTVFHLLERVPGIRRPTSTAIARIAGYLFVLLGLVTALSAVGLDFGPVLTILLLLGLVAVLVGRPLLADLGAGAVLQSRRPVRIDDVVRARGFEGVVEEIDGRVVRLRTYDGWEVRVRNSDILTDPIVKVARPDRVRVEFNIGLHYDTDLDTAVDVATRALADTHDVLSDPRPEAMVDAFAESTIELRCWLWAHPDRRYRVKDWAMRSVKRSLDDHGIAIAYPHRVVQTSS